MKIPFETVFLLSIASCQAALTLSPKTILRRYIGVDEIISDFRNVTTKIQLISDSLQQISQMTQKVDAIINKRFG